MVMCMVKVKNRKILMKVMHLEQTFNLMQQSKPTIHIESPETSFDQEFFGQS